MTRWNTMINVISKNIDTLNRVWSTSTIWTKCTQSNDHFIHHKLWWSAAASPLEVQVDHHQCLYNHNLLRFDHQEINRAAIHHQSWWPARWAVVLHHESIFLVDVHHILHKFWWWPLVTINQIFNPLSLSSSTTSAFLVDDRIIIKIPSLINSQFSQISTTPEGNTFA